MPARAGRGGPRGGRGARGAGSRGPSRNAPGPRGAGLPVSLGNGRSARGRGSGRPRGSGAWRGSPCGPVGTSPLDYLRSALRPQPRPRPAGAPPGRRLRALAWLQRFLPTPGRPSRTWAAPARGATPRASARTFPGAAGAWRPRAHPRPLHSQLPGGPEASRSTPRFPEPPGEAALRRGSGGSRREGELELGPPRSSEMSSGLSTRKPPCATTS